MCKLLIFIDFLSTIFLRGFGVSCVMELHLGRTFIFDLTSILDGLDRHGAANCCRSEVFRDVIISQVKILNTYRAKAICMYDHIKNRIAFCDITSTVGARLMDLTTWISIFMAVIAVATAIVTHSVVRSTTHPTVTVYAQPNLQRQPIVNLTVENIGKVAATEFFYLAVPYHK